MSMMKVQRVHGRIREENMAIKMAGGTNGTWQKQSSEGGGGGVDRLDCRR
jgi:hypothetical protein